MTNKENFVEGYEFDYLASRPFYARCPNWLIDKGGIHENSVVIDLGCGSGITTEFLLERFAGKPGPAITAIDPSEPELSIAKSRISDGRASFFPGLAQEVQERVDKADSVILCNVCHQVPLPERLEICKSVYGLLNSGGSLGFNTLYYAGGKPPGTLNFYAAWMGATAKYLKKEGRGHLTDQRTAPAYQLLTVEEHKQMLEDAGFKDCVVEEVHFDWGFEDFEALSKYSVFIKNIVQDTDLELGSRALIEGLRQAYSVLNLKTVPRGWLHAVGFKS